MATAAASVIMNNQSTTKKLTLARETLRTLCSDDLAIVNGGKGITDLTGGLAGLAGAMYHDTVYRPGQDNAGNNDTVYRGGGKIIPL